MTDEEARGQFRRRLHQFYAAMLTLSAICLVTSFAFPALTVPAFLAVAPFMAFGILNLRCWRCGKRLVANGGAYVTYRHLWGPCWKFDRHTACGAELD